MKYPVLLTPDPKGFLAAVIDVRACTAHGDTASSALSAVGEIMRVIFQDLEKTEATFPYPHSLQDVIQRPDIKAALDTGALLGMVGVRRECGSVSFSQQVFGTELLKAIDMDAERRHLSREEWLEAAALEKLTRGPS